MMRYAWFILVLTLAGCASFLQQTDYYQNLYGASAPKQRVLTEEEAAGSKSDHKVSFIKDVKPILDSRCVVCHSCYDAPCQLKLGSIEGIDRGATKQLVYDFVRFKPADPTRLFIDATDTAGWRAKKFYPVLNEREDGAVSNLDNSLLAQMLELKQENPLPTAGKLDKDFDLDIDRKLECPTRDEFSGFELEHPKWGMPYGLPGLSQNQIDTLNQWLKEGAKAEPLPALSKPAQAKIADWETYLNKDDLKHKLVARYLYEHLFIGHLHFQGHPESEFFRLVRSLTPPGTPIKEITTPRPYNHPGNQAFYYRLRSVTETIVDKTHFVYELSAAKMRRIDELFFTPGYEVTKLPPYQGKDGANPFLAYAELPMVSRYKFLLDDAEYFVSGFIKGPVCRGQIATESIRDRFWVVFLQPGKFFPQQVAKALVNNSQLLSLPDEEEDSIGLMDWVKYDSLGREYLKKKDELIDALLPQNQGFGMEHIWDGDGVNRNAALTVFRHFNSATVVKGLIGTTPLTAWVVDYPLLERLHYLLVAGFNPYGTAGHQLASRTYMDILRQGAQDNFLRFMPAMERRSIYNSWYQGETGFRKADAYFNVHHETQVKFKTTNYQDEFFHQVRTRLGNAVLAQSALTVCKSATCKKASGPSLEQKIDQAMQNLTRVKGLDLSALPEMSLVKVDTGERGAPLAYTLLVDKAYANITNMLDSESQRKPEMDELTVVPGIVGSYPNFFFHVSSNEIEEFILALKSAKDVGKREQFYETYGIRRTNPAIWEYSDWFNRQNKTQKGLQAGWLDMARYENL